MRLIDADRLIEQFKNRSIQTTFDLPVEEVLGPDIDLESFLMLLRDAIMAYKKMVLDTIRNQPTTYNVDAVVKQQAEKLTINKAKEIAAKAICIGCGYLTGYECSYKGRNCMVSKPMLESVVKAFDNWSSEKPKTTESGFNGKIKTTNDNKQEEKDADNR